jgi:hypothetical protein
MKRSEEKEKTQPKKRPKLANPLEGVDGFFDRAMHDRLLDSPKNNFDFWDALEPRELERYLKRCKGLEERVLLRPKTEAWRMRFFANWANIHKAFNFSNNLLSNYAMPPRARPDLVGRMTHYKEMFLNFYDSDEYAANCCPETTSKAAIREGLAFPCFRVFKKEEIRSLIADARAFLENTKQP